MSRSDRLRAEDYRSLLRVCAELGEVAPDPLARRRHALASLAGLCETSCGLFCHTAMVDGRYRLMDNVTVGLDDAPQDLLADYFAGRLPLDPCAPAIESAGPAAGNVTALRRQLVDDATWAHDDHAQGFRRHLHLDDGVYSRVIGPRGAVFGVALIRQKGDRPLAERHRTMLAVFNDHAHRLYQLDRRVEASPMMRLAPRLRPVAQRFMAGDSVKEAARHLGLSRHTVVEYAKGIYRTFGVSSRAELLVALLAGSRGRT